ncbi:MAG: tRNA (adenosine(37)-N6)-dimethylallyltransferase MiaA [Elusimicrobia bacterium RIFOXYA1_FULL_47_7]|nr:MAG: tRNA (adenosine(37)-N6)-dimethylallyltransferase MiaA [Elusimicrobia bacterium RIFOXYA1_FULL_47_7]
MVNIILTGATASGKTAVGAELAKILKGEIISADSRQVYRYLDIGTNKAGQWDAEKSLRVYKGIPQHLTDIIEPDGYFSAGDFRKAAVSAIKKIEKKSRLPIIAGGTGLYIKALSEGLNELPEKDDAIRNELKEMFEKHGAKYLYDKLSAVDAESAEKNKSNPQRLIRALEVYRISGVPISEWHKKPKKPAGEFLQFGLLWDKEELYSNIEKRSAEMLKNGMIDEAKKVLSLGFKKDCPGLSGIGYSRVIDFLEEKISLDETAALISLDPRHYAKRQMTWFRKNPNIRWIKVSGRSFDPVSTASKIAKSI